MSGPTILAYFTDESRAARLTEIVMRVAQINGGRLIGVYVGAQFIVYPSVGFDLPASIFEDHHEAQAARAAKIEKIFLDATAGATLDVAWRYIPPNGSPVVDLLTPHVRCCDLVVADLFEGEASDDPFAEVAEAMALQSGRPILLVPEGARVDDAFLNHALVAWDGGRESARAVFDALPILKGCEKVRVVSVEEAFDDGVAGEIPASEIAATLAHHGVACTADKISRKGASVAAVLLDHANAAECGLIVMGAYGHARWREIIFGGTTREVLRNASTPIFVSH